jgi:hypothetical protein
VLTIRQALEQTRRVFSPEVAAELEQWVMARPKAEVKDLPDKLALVTAATEQVDQQGDDVKLMLSPLLEYACAVCHHGVAQPTFVDPDLVLLLAEDDPDPDRVRALLRRPDALRLRFVCRCRRGSWTRDGDYVREAIDAAGKAGRRKVPV